MGRRSLFAVLAAVSAALAACGRQVTPNPPDLNAGGANPGFMTVKFDVAGPFDFSNYQYWIVFNTSGNRLSPLTNPTQNNFAAFSNAIMVGAVNGATAAQPYQWIKGANPAASPAAHPFQVSPNQLQYVVNSNGSGTEFTLTFARSIFVSHAAATPTPGASAAPYAKTWLFNAFVTQANSQGQMLFVDSMGAGGGTDTTWVSPPLPICTNFDNPYYKNADLNPPSDPAAQIASVEIANNGATRTCPP